MSFSNVVKFLFDFNYIFILLGTETTNAKVDLALKVLTVLKSKLSLGVNL